MASSMPTSYRPHLPPHFNEEALQLVTTPTPRTLIATWTSSRGSSRPHTHIKLGSMCLAPLPPSVVPTNQALGWINWATRHVGATWAPARLVCETCVCETCVRGLCARLVCEALCETCARLASMNLSTSSTRDGSAVASTS